MTLRECRAKVIEIKQLTHDVKEIALEMISPARLVFKAGQYIAFEITEIRNGVARRNNRPYSIVSPPEEDTVIRLCVNLVSGGPGSSYLHGIEIGETVNFFSPFGYFTIDTEASTDLLFVATGTGIAPLYSMMQHLLNQGSQRPMRLYWGLRSERDVYYQDVFGKWKAQYPFFQYVMTLSRPSESWKGMKGRVTEHVQNEIRHSDCLEAYLCGNMEMIREVRTVLLEKGLGKKSIHFEKFY